MLAPNRGCVPYLVVPAGAPRTWWANARSALEGKEFSSHAICSQRTSFQKREGRRQEPGTQVAVACTTPTTGRRALRAAQRHLHRIVLHRPAGVDGVDVSAQLAAARQPSLHRAGKLSADS